MTPEEEKKSFINATKLVLKEQISSNELTLINQRNTIIEAYNSFISYVSDNYKEKERVGQIAYVQTKLQQCIQKFNSNYQLPVNRFELIINENK